MIYRYGGARLRSGCGDVRVVVIDPGPFILRYTIARAIRRTAKRN